MRFQQYSGPVMAKGLEDTAFYRYNRLLALNEVGGASGRRSAISAPPFHQANERRRARQHPHAMLADIHPRHQARRGHPRAPGGCFGLADGMGAAGAAWSRLIRARRGGRSTTRAARPQRRIRAATSCCSAPGRRSSSPARRSPTILRWSRLHERVQGAMLKSVREAQAALELGVGPTRATRRRCSAWLAAALDATRGRIRSSTRFGHSRTGRANSATTTRSCRRC